MKIQSKNTVAILTTMALVTTSMVTAGPVATIEKNFRELPMEARRLTGPLFWMHGDENARNGSNPISKKSPRAAMAASPPSRARTATGSDRAGSTIWKSASTRRRNSTCRCGSSTSAGGPASPIGGTVPPRYAAKSLVAEAMDANGPGVFEATGFGGERYIGAVAGQPHRRQPL